MADVEAILTNSEKETSAAGERLAARLRAGDVLLLHGDLGAGKTAFVRGMAEGLGADPADVSSPTFTILQQYPGTPMVYHADLYRLSGGGDERELGLEELPGPRGVLAVEWAERLSRPPWERAIRVDLEHAGADTRHLRVETEP